MTATDTTTKSNANIKVKAPEFGAGRYSPLMEECYHDLMVIFKLPSDKAEKLARQIGSEIGAAFRNQPVTVKSGKVSEDGKMTVSEAAKIKGVTVTNALMALRAIHWCNDAIKNGIARKDTKWVPIPALAQYFDSL